MDWFIRLLGILAWECASFFGGMLGYWGIPRDIYFEIAPTETPSIAEITVVTIRSGVAA